jgi:hypothetical protein
MALDNGEREFSVVIFDLYLIPFMESNESFKIAVKRGAAIVQIAVTKPVVIRTTSTHPGTSPSSSFNRAKNKS